ncbi:MAG: hypothetical protein K5837_02990 [Candidatus Saccharibacteria bacterium]|nr:hypothetical protein [Candidatus Saccharibacteria bacterium]
MGNLVIYGEPHYRQNYLDQILLDELASSTPDELKIVMLDSSIDSLSEFGGVPHLLFSRLRRRANTRRIKSTLW